MTANKGGARRPWYMALMLQLGIRVRYALESWLFLKPFLAGITAYKSAFRPANCPQYDFTTSCGMQLVWALSSMWKAMPILFLVARYTGLSDLLSLLHSWLCERLIKQMKASGWQPDTQREVCIPEYDWKNGSPEEFYELFVRKPHPVVLRGFMNNTALLKEMGWQSLLSKYGDEDVMLTTKELDGTPGKLKDVDNPAVYLHNSEVLFQKYPEINDYFQFERLEPYLHMKAGYSQIFVGRNGTGSPFHNAAVHNMFYMVDGKKKWYFIDPYDTFLLYPIFVAGRPAAISQCLYPDMYNTEAFPLFKYCPTYSTVLEPGDVLYNPPWWWHGIKNITDATVGIASRWHTDGIAGHKLQMTEEDYDINRFGSWAFLMGPASIPFLHGILQEPSPRFDEHMTLREMKNRYVHAQRKFHEDGGYDVLGRKYVM